MFEKLKKFYKGWVEFGKKVANFQVKIIFTIFYFLFIIPIALIVKIFSSKNPSGWQAVSQEEIDIERAKRQF